jgi:hypothetical protein
LARPCNLPYPGERSQLSVRLHAHDLPGRLAIGAYIVHSGLG